MGKNGTTMEKKEEKEEAKEEDEAMIEEEEVEEYREMLEELGNHPDKVQINTLSMVADDHASSPRSAEVLHGCIRSLLISPSVGYDRKLPLIYVLDSILKNVGRAFVPIVEADAPSWIPVVHASFKERRRPELNQKLHKVLNTWKDFGIFQPQAVQTMIRSFQEADAVSTVAQAVNGSNGGSGGSTDNNQGLLDNVSPQLKLSMQSVLDDIQSEGDELDKVSLERLAIIDPPLLGQIKTVALNLMKNNNTNNITTTNSNDTHATTTTTANTTDTTYPHSSSLFSSRLPAIHRQRSQDWINVGFTKNQCRDLVGSLQQSVRTSSSTTTHHHHSGLMAAAAATANHISITLQVLQRLEDEKENEATTVHSNTNTFNNHHKSPSISVSLLLLQVDKSLFTTAGIMKMKHHGIVGSLYDQGLPFVSTSDGRRFATQIELSKHFDAFFKKSQLEKTMERTEERGWHISSCQWSMTETDDDHDNNASSPNANPAADGEEVNNNTALDPTSTSTISSSSCVPADETRSRCAICGNPFEMFFDQELGDHMYLNCREIQVLNDDAAEQESELVLVHIRCLQGLGNPHVLTVDEVLQNY